MDTFSAQERSCEFIKYKFPSIIVRTTENPGVELIQRMMMILLAGHRCGDRRKSQLPCPPHHQRRERKKCAHIYYYNIYRIGCVKVQTVWNKKSSPDPALPEKLKNDQKFSFSLGTNERRFLHHVRSNLAAAAAAGIHQVGKREREGRGYNHYKPDDQPVANPVDRQPSCWTGVLFIFCIYLYIHCFFSHIYLGYIWKKRNKKNRFRETVPARVF